MKNFNFLYGLCEDLLSIVLLVMLLGLATCVSNSATLHGTSFDEKGREAYRVLRSENGAENRFDSAVNDILNEGTAAYFDGTKRSRRPAGTFRTVCPFIFRSSIGSIEYF